MLEDGIQTVLPHAPLSKDALDQSVVELIEIREPLPDFQDCFADWIRELDKGDAGFFSIPVAEIISANEDAVRRAQAENSWRSE